MDAERPMEPVRTIADQLEKPSLDDRSYRVIQLPNKLEALLVHDPDTDKASASVNVNVGSFSDADDMPGMAHAVEHLLFMGTEKYPVENAYNQYLTANSGYSNAYTAARETNYFFEVGAKSGKADTNPDEMVPKEDSPLYGALDRFAQFFISPLFLASTLDRELCAVDSENKKNLQSDNWRFQQLYKSLSNPKHPYHHFSTGNLETLRDEPRKRGIQIRDEFMSFHDRHYSANRMKLVVLGREPLDQLQDWVAELFADVKNKDLPKNRWDDQRPLTEAELCTQIFAKPVMESRSLEMFFPYQDEELLYESQPSRYLSHLIGHEGPGSILAYIKAKGWANGLSAGILPVCPGSDFFSISVRLTEEGLKSYQEVTKVIFQYISLLKDSEPQQWIFDEMKNMAEVDFRFKEKSRASKFTSSVSSVMQKPLPRDWLLSGSDLFRKFEPELIKKGLSHLNENNFRFSIISQDFPGDWNQKEKWYGTEYRVEKFSPEFAQSIKEAMHARPQERLSELHLPHKNEFIPTRFTVEKKEISKPAVSPKLIRHDEGVRTWWKKDDTFWVPKANVLVTMRNPVIAATPANFVKSKIYCELVTDALVEYSYDAEIAGLDYSLSSSTFGIDIDLSGYNDKMSVLLEKVLVSLRDLEIKQDRFDIIKERMSRAYRNAEYSQPFHQVGSYMNWLGTERRYVNEQLGAELPHIEMADVKSFFPQLLKQLHIEILAHGNLYKEDALNITNLVESTLKPRPLPTTQWPIKRNLIIQKSSDFTYSRPLKDPKNVNHCIEYFLYVGRFSDDVLRAKLMLFAQMTEEPAFDQLRTKEQLGYVVFTGQRYNSTTMGYRVIIQSERPCDYLEQRIDSFLTTFGKNFDTMSEESFESHKLSVINKRLEKLKNMDQESSRFWNHIGTEYFDFNQNERDVTNLRPLRKADLVAFFHQYISPASQERAKLAIHMVAQASSEAKEPAVTDPAEQSSKLQELLVQYLESLELGVPVDAGKLEKRFESIDISAGDQDEVLKAMEAFLKDDLSVPAEKVQEVSKQGKAILGQVFSVLGIKSKGADEGLLNEAPPKSKPSTIIEDVHAFKASLTASEGPKPVVDLSTFEETEAKL